jgi:hypothetical protein
VQPTHTEELHVRGAQEVDFAGPLSSALDLLARPPQKPHLTCLQEQARHGEAVEQDFEVMTLLAEDFGQLLQCNLLGCNPSAAEPAR